MDVEQEILGDITAIVAVVTLVTAVYKYYENDLRAGRDWEGSITRNRHHIGAYRMVVPQLIDDLKEDDTDGLPSNQLGTFRNYFRLSKPQFEKLLDKVRTFITREDTVMRASISAEERLMITLRYLATGMSMSALRYEWAVSTAAISQIIPETCGAIHQALKDDFLTAPATPEEWVGISNALEHTLNFPNALGAIDGKHILLTKPWRAGSPYYNYKGSESIILMAVCDANYRFTYIDVKTKGRPSDESVFSNTPLLQSIEDLSLQLPEPRTPPNGDVALPYVFVGDGGLPLKNFLMRPYPGRLLSEDRKVFNDHLSRCRRLIERTFGIFVATWRIFAQKISVKPEKAKLILLACCSLHNCLREGVRPPQGHHMQDIIDGAEQGGIGPLCPAAVQTDANAMRIRDQFKDYVNVITPLPQQTEDA